MKNFISAIYIKTNSITEERICIGLFVASNEKSYFGWSENKLKIISKLTSEKVYQSLYNSFTSLNKEIKFSNADGYQKRIFESNKFSFEYFNYLSNYSKGLIEFSEPKIISNTIKGAEFAELYKMYLGESILAPTKKKTTDTLAKKVNHLLNNIIFKERANVNFEIDEKIIGTIYRPQKVDFISCNKGIYAGLIVDFTGSPSAIENKLYEFRVLVEGLKIFSEKRHFKNSGKYEIFFNTPTGIEQKKILDNAKLDKSSPFKLIEIERLEDVTKTLEKNNYKKFSEIL